MMNYDDLDVNFPSYPNEQHYNALFIQNHLRILYISTLCFQIYSNKIKRTQYLGINITKTI